MWAKEALLVVLVLVSAWPLAEAQARVVVTQEILVEIALDRSERLTWRLHSENALADGLLLPAGASVRNVTAFGGPLPHRVSVRDDGQVFVQPGRTTYQFTVEAHLPPPAGELHPLYARRWSASAFEGAEDRISVRVRAPEGFLLFHGAPAMPEENGTEMRAQASDRFLLAYAYRAPLDPAEGLVEIDEGIYHLIGPARAERQMRELARLATASSASAAEQAGLPLRSPYWVRFAPERVFGHEAGYYGFDGILALRRSHLNGTTASGWPYAAAEALVHETFHATSAPHGLGAFRETLTWWLEGTARYAERHVSGDDGWRACEGSWCWTFQSQLRADELEALYAADWEFDAAWQPGSLAEEARALHYEYSAFLVAAYIQRYGHEAYAATWRDVLAAAADPTCACDEARLRQTLIRHSGGRLSDAELYAPFRDLRVEDPRRYGETLEALVAHEPRAGAPVPWTLPPRRDAPAPPAPAPTFAPALAWDEPPPHRVSWATVVALRVADLDVNETRTSEAPHARLRWRLDGQDVDPGLSVRGDRVVATFRGVAGGEHVVEVEVRRPGGGTFTPELRLESRFTLPPAYAWELLAPVGDVVEPGARIEGRLVDALDGTPFVGLGVLLEADGIPIHLNVTDAGGRVGFVLPAAAPGRLALGFAVEGAGDAQGARLERLFTVPAPAPLESAGVVPAAALEPEDARVPFLGMMWVVGVTATAAWMQRGRLRR